MKRRRGYILPMTLALLGLAGLVLDRICRQQMRESVAANDAAGQLQRKWAFTSCQATLLPQAGALLDRETKAARRPVRWMRSDLVLNGVRFSFVVADESAKANLNMLHSRYGSMECERAARASAHAGRTDLLVRLRPMAGNHKASADGDAPPVFGSFGQVFDEGREPSPASVLAGTRDVTCWGNGKLNWRRAPLSALQPVLHDDRVLAGAIVALQAGGPEANLKQLNGSLKPPAETLKLMERVLTDSSDCYSLWLTGGGETRLAVRELTEEGRSRVTRFDW